MRHLVVLLLPVLLAPFSALGDDPDPVGDDWALRIVLFDVGQADAALVLARNGEAALIDVGRKKAHGLKIAAYLLDEGANGIDDIDSLKYLLATHYDADHIGDVIGLEGNVTVQACYDQGPSEGREPENPRTVYSKYVQYVGDHDGDGEQDAHEPDFVRHRAEPGQRLTVGDAEIIILSVRGDTAGIEHDLDLDPSEADINENPGSLITLVRLRHFEYLTTGDATSDDWKSEPDTEEALIAANAIPGGDDIDVLKVSHHGSDTSTGQTFVAATKPEVAIISTDLTHHRLPKLTTLKTLEQNGALTLVTGRARSEDGEFHQSAHAFGDGFSPHPETLKDEQGRIVISVSANGERYTVTTAAGGTLTKSARDGDNR